jgi:hypothetical protein
MQRRWARVLVIAAALLGAASQAAGQSDRVTRDALIGLARVKRDAGDLRASADAFRRADRMTALDRATLQELFWVLAEVDPADARVIGSKVLEEDAANEALRDRLVALAQRAGDESAVVALALGGTAHNRTTGRWPRRLGESYLRQQNPVDAAAWFVRAATAADATEADGAWLAVSLEAAGDRTASLQSWNALNPAVWNAKPEWARSRLRAVAAAGGPETAIADLDAWVTTNPDDAEMRLLLVDLLERQRQPARALGILGRRPAERGHEWLAREARLATLTGDFERAIRAQQTIARRPEAQPNDLIALGHLLVETGRQGEAFTVAERLTARVRGCDDAALALMARIETEAALEAFSRAVASYPATCTSSDEWTRRAVSRLTSVQKFGPALRLLRPVATRPHASVNDRELFGQLLLWTGSHEDAIRALEPLVREHAHRDEAAEALVDAYRATRRSADAWRIALPRLKQWRLDSQRLLELAGLALERGAVAAAVDLAARASAQDPSTINQSRAIHARALVAAGRLTEALALVQAIPAAALDEPGALAWLEALRGVQGRADALRAATDLEPRVQRWSEVLAKVALWTEQELGAEAAAMFRTRLGALDQERAALLDVELALGSGNAAEALQLTEAASDGRANAASERWLDLRSLALADAGRYDEAGELAARLSAARPDDVGLLVRAATYRGRHEDARSAAGDRHQDQIAELRRLAAAHSDRADVRLALASALLEDGLAGDAIDVLSSPATFPAPSAQWRVLLARAARAAGDLRRALDTIPEPPALDVHDALLRAELVLAVEGAHVADRAYASLAARRDATAEVFLAWARARGDLDSIEPLTAGRTRFPDSTELVAALARTHLNARDVAAAGRSAQSVLARDAANVTAWEVLIDAVRADAAAHPIELLHPIPHIFAARPLTVLRFAEQLGRSGASSSIVDLAISWIRGAPFSDEERPQARIAEATLLASASRWPDALAVLHDRQTPDALRLRAQVLAWSGRHDDALSAFDRYLGVAPDDIAARREQARVAGWAQQFARAERLYSTLESEYPTLAAVRAEAAAKRLYFAGKWRAAVTAYERWLKVEPSNDEARFELAEALNAAGHTTSARNTYAALAAREQPHHTAAAARDRLNRRSRASVAAFSNAGTSEGYQGQRLLGRTETGARITLPLFANPEQRFTVSAGMLTLRGQHERRDGRTARADVTISPTSIWQISASASAADIDRVASTWDGAVDVTSRPTDRIHLNLGVARTRLWENLAAVEAGVATWGPRGGIRFVAPGTEFSIHAAGARAGDNERVVAGTSVAQRIWRGRNELYLIGDSEWMSWRRSDARYFSPAAFVRVNGGAEWRRWVHTPRFRDDRKDQVAVGYLLGSDNRGAIYHQPRARLSFELGSVSFDASGSWIVSPVFRAAEFGLALRVGG